MFLFFFRALFANYWPVISLIRFPHGLWRPEDIIGRTAHLDACLRPVDRRYGCVKPWFYTACAFENLHKSPVFSCTNDKQQTSCIQFPIDLKALMVIVWFFNTCCAENWTVTYVCCAVMTAAPKLERTIKFTLKL